MSTATGTPVFVTVGGDASAATATYTASGATTSTTVALSDLAASVAENTTAVTTANTNASAAVTTATAAQSTANSASQTAGSALTAAQASLQPSAIWANNGVAGTNSTGDLSVPAGKSVLIPNGSVFQCTLPGTPASAYYRMGYYGCDVNHTLAIYSGTNASGAGQNDFVAYWTGGTGNFDGTQYINALAISPAQTNYLTLGSANNTYAGLFLQSAATIVSDINQKTNIELLNSDADGIASALGVTTTSANQTALFAAVRSIPLCLFTYKTGKRIHVGTIAQFVEAAFKKQGLDPADYGLWCENTAEDVSFETDENGKTTVTTSTPATATVQTLRMEEFLALKLAQVEYDLTAKTAATTA